MIKVEMITLRMNLLGGMNDYIINVLGDEDYIEIWLAEGVPDGADEDFLREIAEDEDDWTFICKLFGNMVRQEYCYRDEN